MKAPPICLKIKLGACLNMPTKTFYRLLGEARRDCDRARNAAFRCWQRWREDHPEWKPEQRRTRDGSPKVNPEGEPVMEKSAWPQGLEKLAYRAACDTASNVAAKIVSACRIEVFDSLASKVPYNHIGNSDFVWQAILSYERSAPCYRDGTIPLPSQDMVLGYEGEFAGANKAGHAPGKGIGLEVSAKSVSAAVLRFPLLSNASGFETKGPIVALNVGELKAGHRRWLRLVARGQAGLCDSELVCRDGQWLAHLMIRPPLAETGPDKNRCAILTPLPPGSSRPFELKIPADEPGTFVTMRIGDGVPYAKLYERLDIRDRSIRHKSRQQRGGGHGRGRFYNVIKPVARSKTNEQDRFTKQLMADILKTCLQNNCGSLLYREPTMPLRNELWFAGRGAPFDWSTFASRLEQKCQFLKIEKARGRKKSGAGWPRISVKEHKDEYKSEWERAA